jgi:hypothetical protein
VIDVKTVWGLVFLALPLCVAAEEEKRPVRVYTNEDLDRVAPFRDQTGVNSVTAAAPETASDPRAKRAKAKDDGNSTEVSGRGQDYWRREADKVRVRVRALQQRAAGLRQRIEQRRRKPKVFPYSDPQIRTWSQRVDEIEAEVREMEAALEQRARRAGALPGWLR